MRVSIPKSIGAVFCDGFGEASEAFEKGEGALFIAGEGAAGGDGGREFFFAAADKAFNSSTLSEMGFSRSTYLYPQSIARSATLT